MATLFGKSKRKRVRTELTDGSDAKLAASSSAFPAGKSVEDASAEGNDHGEGKDAASGGASASASVPWAFSFEDLGLAEPLVDTCRQLGFKRPTPVQREIVPWLLREKSPSQNLLALAATGSGKTAAFALPIIHHLSRDPYGIYAVVLTPTRELAKQIHQQVLALGSCYNVRSALVIGGLDSTRQSCELDKRPHFCVATPGRLAELLRGPKPPRIQHARYIVLDEADRLLAANSGFERDVAELLLHCTTRVTSTTPNTGADGKNETAPTSQPQRQRREQCQTLLFSATMSRSFEQMEDMAGAGLGRLPLKKFVIREDSGDDDNDRSASKKKNKKQRREDKDCTADGNLKKALESDSDDDDDNDDDDDDDDENDNNEDSPEASAPGHPKIPAGLKQEYVFMPSRVRDAYLLTTIRTLMVNGGRSAAAASPQGSATGVRGSGWTIQSNGGDGDDNDDDGTQMGMARSAIVFVSTCERAGFVSELLSQVGVDNVALHSLLSQNRRLASLGKFKSQQVRVLVATDVASRGLDIPSVDLVINSELPRNPTNYVHRVGRTARAGRRGRAVSLVAESDIGMVHAAERLSGRSLGKCAEITDDAAIKLLGPVAKAARLTKMKLMDIGFDELVEKFRERKARDRKERERIDRALRRIEGKQQK